MIISDEIYRRFSESTEGELAKKLSFLVCKATLKKIANDIMIEDFIEMKRGGNEGVFISKLL